MSIHHPGWVEVGISPVDPALIVAAHDAEARTPEGFEVEFFAPKPTVTEPVSPRPSGRRRHGWQDKLQDQVFSSCRQPHGARPADRTVQRPFLYCRLGWEAPIQRLGELLVGDGCSQRLAQTANIHPSEARRER